MSKALWRQVLKCRNSVNKLNIGNGKTLCWNEYGHPKGFPIIHFHSENNCNLEALLFHTAALENGIRIIAVDRPGFGKTPFSQEMLKSGYKLETYSRDIGRLLRHLKIENNKFGISGVSQGCSFAIANLRYLTEIDLNARFGVLFGSLPLTLELNNKIVPKYVTQTLKNLENYPSMVAKPSLMLERNLIMKNFDNYLKYFDRMKILSETDKKNLDLCIQSKFVNKDEIDNDSKRLTTKYVLSLVMKDGMMNPDSINGSLWSMKNAMQYKTIGFKLSDIDSEMPIYFYHGKQDGTIPIEWQRQYINELEEYWGLKGVKSIEIDDAGHFLPQRAWNQAALDIKGAFL